MSHSLVFVLRDYGTFSPGSAEHFFKRETMRLKSKTSIILKTILNSDVVAAIENTTNMST
jgi:hypothetical protein